MARGARSGEGQDSAIEALRSEGHPGDVRTLTIDVRDDASVVAASDQVRETGLDVLVNNAGVAGTVPPAAEATAADVADVFAVNTLGPVRTTHAFLPLLRTSASPRVVNISSAMASFARMTDRSVPGSDYPDLAYPASKAALNMLTTQYAKTVPDVCFVAVEPGYTATDLNAHSGHQTATRAAANVVAAVLATDLASGSYVGPDGPMAW